MERVKHLLADGIEIPWMEKFLAVQDMRDPRFRRREEPDLLVEILRIDPAPRKFLVIEMYVLLASEQKQPCRRLVFFFQFVEEPRPERLDLGRHPRRRQIGRAH